MKPDKVKRTKAIVGMNAVTSIMSITNAAKGDPITAPAPLTISKPDDIATI